MGDIVLQGAGSFRPNRRDLSKKPWWKRHIPIRRKPRDGGAPHLRNADPLPLVDAIPLDIEASPLGQFLSHLGCPAELVDEISVHGQHGASVLIFLRYVKADDLDDIATLTRDAPRMSANRKPYDVLCGRRLRQARFALGYDKRGDLRRFAKNTGVPESNYNNWELGNALVRPDYVQKLKEVFGVTHDWIYGGDSSQMTRDMQVSLLAAQMAIDEPEET